MSTREEKSWSLWCDWPECKHSFEDGDYSIFGDGYDPEQIVTDSDGHVSNDGTRHYCSKHPAVWSSDAEPYPAPPFLLIHDGMKYYEDGRVTLVEHLHAGGPCLVPGACPFRAIETEAAHYESLIIAEGVQ